MELRPAYTHLFFMTSINLRKCMHDAMNEKNGNHSSEEEEGTARRQGLNLISVLRFS